MAHLEFMPEERIQLMLECRRHPKLMSLLIPYGPHQDAEALAEIATYCGILLDDTLSFEEINILCKVLTESLREMRTIVVYNSTNGNGKGVIH